MTAPEPLISPAPQITSVEQNGELLKATLSGGTVLWIPQDANNAEYKAVQAWVAAGGTITN